LPACVTTTAVVFQDLLDLLEELRGVELFGDVGAVGVRQIHYHDVVFIAGLQGVLHVDEAVFYHHPCPGVVEGALMHLWEVPPRQLHHVAVYVHHHGSLDGLVL